MTGAKNVVILQDSYRGLDRVQYAPAGVSISHPAVTAARLLAR